MYAKTKMNWLKALALVALSQFCFLVGTAQAHAEETTATQPTVEAIAQVASEVTEVPTNITLDNFHIVLIF